jgi:hypothetical protein
MMLCCTTFSDGSQPTALHLSSLSDGFFRHNDAWPKPSEENVHAGVCLRISEGKFRVFPHGDRFLEPFETAIRVLNPAVAVKVRTTAVHVALNKE